MYPSNSSSWRRTLLLAVVVSIAWTLASVAVFADMRIQIGNEDFTQEFWFKNAHIRISQPDMDILFDCKAETFALLAPDAKRYWQGTLDEFRGELNALFAMMAESTQPIDIFSTTDIKPITVRTTRGGTDTVAGYDAIHYVVEYQADGTWHVFEETWIAPALLQEIEAETGLCMNTIVHDFTLTLIQLQLFGWLDDDPMFSVITSPEYLALANEGFPVRNLSVTEMFGMRFESISEVEEVSRDPLDDAFFVIPDDYKSMTLLEAIS